MHIKKKYLALYLFEEDAWKTLLWDTYLWISWLLKQLFQAECMSGIPAVYSSVTLLGFSVSVHNEFSLIILFEGKLYFFPSHFKPSIWSLLHAISSFTLTHEQTLPFQHPPRADDFIECHFFGLSHPSAPICILFQNLHKYTNPWKNM